MLMLKDTERDILLTEMKSLQDLRGMKVEDSIPPLGFETQRSYLNAQMSNGLVFVWTAAPQGVAAAEDDDYGGSLHLTEGRKGRECCSMYQCRWRSFPSLTQGVGRERKRKSQVSLPYTMSCNSGSASERPNATFCSLKHQKNNVPLRYSWPFQRQRTSARSNLGSSMHIRNNRNRKELK